MQILHLQESLSKYERMQDGSTPQVQTCHPAMGSFNQASAQVWHRLGTALRIMLGVVLQSCVCQSLGVRQNSSHTCASVSAYCNSGFLFDTGTGDRWTWYICWLPENKNYVPSQLRHELSNIPCRNFWCISLFVGLGLRQICISFPW